MAQGKQAIKSRIKSINTTKKITSAMELISNAKLTKQRNQMERNREYATILQRTVNQLVAHNPKVDNKFMKPKKSDKVLTIVFCSDLGLCGGYNSNAMKLVEQSTKKEDPMILIGTHQYSWLKNRGYHLIEDMISSDAIDFSDIKTIVNKAIHMFLEDEVGRVQVIYTKFINTVSFEPTLMNLLPCEISGEIEEVNKQETEFVPDENEILDHLLPMMLQNVVYSTCLQTKTAEHGSRRAAMENATDNATELNDKLLLQYNQARQAAITQEITEIVGGADAL
ncbi:MAG: ATP synthase F1 subunit gamma [Erysipelotrichaceae bacterium]|nr:ATP synthase F1 subunit gamma [Erysipelotrichaceae bacterium]